MRTSSIGDAGADMFHARLQANHSFSHIVCELEGGSVLTLTGDALQ